MSHFITVPVNENGVVYDAGMSAVVSEAMLPYPFGFNDVFVYSHGWSTDAASALDSYNRFSVDFARRSLEAALLTPAILKRPPGPALGMGVHWPSEITEDPGSPLNKLQLFTFYTMEHRADVVGKNALYAMLRLIVQSRATTDAGLRVMLLGHSFGCKVICAALQDLQVDMASGAVPSYPNLSFDVALLEPATDQDNLDPGDIYGDVCRIASSRLLITTSQLDKALCVWYKAAGDVANIVHPKNGRDALGAVGPTANTIAAFGGSPDRLSVGPGFTAVAGMAGLSARLTIADLTPIHAARVNAGLYAGGFSGSHSDIYIDEVYQLVMGFLFGT